MPTILILILILVLYIILLIRSPTVEVRTTCKHLLQLQVVDKVQSAIARCDFPPILNQTVQHFLFVPVTPLEVNIFSSYKCLRETDSTQRKGIAE